MDNVKEEVKLAQNGSLHDLQTFLKRTFFCEEAQVALVERNENKLILLYIKYYSLKEKAQLALVKQKNIQVLKNYLEKHSLCILAQKALGEALM
ncbi:MAG: hypothetical protein J6W96_01305 [Alphaproteobacteria bacterium]|nr:hypothetical protein [Alphaproteobacteria bacterium]